jgi:hypothetical protein
MNLGRKLPDPVRTLVVVSSRGSITVTPWPVCGGIPDPTYERGMAMPRIIVASDAPDRDGVVVTLDEHVAPSELEARSHSVELIERIGWAVHDAYEAEQEGEGQAPTPAAGVRSTGDDLDHNQGSALSQVAHAVREHENSTRRSVRPATAADRNLYRRLRRALDR